MLVSSKGDEPKDKIMESWITFFISFHLWLTVIISTVCYLKKGEPQEMKKYFLFPFLLLFNSVMSGRAVR